MSSSRSMSETAYSSDKSESVMTMGELWLPLPKLWEELSVNPLVLMFSSASDDSKSEITIGELCLSTTREELGAILAPSAAAGLGVGVAVARARRAA